MTFRLLGRALDFRTVRRFDYFGIPCVYGITLDGKWQTTARVADVVFSDSRS